MTKVLKKKLRRLQRYDKQYDNLKTQLGHIESQKRPTQTSHVTHSNRALRVLMTKGEYTGNHGTVTAVVHAKRGKRVRVMLDNGTCFCIPSKTLEKSSVPIVRTEVVP